MPVVRMGTPVSRLLHARVPLFPPFTFDAAYASCVYLRCRLYLRVVTRRKHFRFQRCVIAAVDFAVFRGGCCRHVAGISLPHFLPPGCRRRQMSQPLASFRQEQHAVAPLFAADKPRRCYAIFSPPIKRRHAAEAPGCMAERLSARCAEARCREFRRPRH